MKYELHIKPAIDKIFFKLGKKDPKQLWIIRKKLAEVCENPHRYKNLRAPLNAWKEVHISQSMGGLPTEDFVRYLNSMMPEPRE